MIHFLFDKFKKSVCTFLMKIMNQIIEKGMIIILMNWNWLLILIKNEKFNLIGDFLSIIDDDSEKLVTWEKTQRRYTIPRFRWSTADWCVERARSDYARVDSRCSTSARLLFFYYTYITVYETHENLYSLL